MGRPRTPTALLEARGAYNRHPERRDERASEPVEARPLPAAPEYFNEGQAICWEAVVAMVPAGVLTAADAALVEVTALAWHELKQQTVEVVTKDGAVVEIRKVVKPSETGAFIACLAKMACTPVDRSRVVVAKPDRPKSDFDKLN